MDAVADEAEAAVEKPRSTAKKMKPAEIIVAVIFTLVVIAGVAEHIAYNDTWTCRTESMEIVYQGMTNYLFSFSANLLQSEEGIKEFVAAMARGKDVFHCNKSKKPLMWFPKGDSKDGARIIAMCPPNSHGWLRKYAWGVAEKSGKIFWVRIKSDGTVVPTD